MLIILQPHSWLMDCWGSGPELYAHQVNTHQLTPHQPRETQQRTLHVQCFILLKEGFQVLIASGPHSWWLMASEGISMILRPRVEFLSSF